MTAPAVAARASAPRRAAHAVHVLWRFARPHTIVGTSLSVAGLYVIAASELTPPGAADLLWVLLAAACVNVAIVGLNQLEDVEIDRVNKPQLPIAAGDLSVPAARRIVAAAFAIPVALALTQGVLETVAVVLALLVGVAYSSPPLRLKRRPAVAAGAISLVRALVVNLGVFLHFSDGEMVPSVWALTLFVLPFSLAIAVLKDVPDIEGDRRYGVSTFSVRLGPRPVLRMGLGLLTAAYLGMAVLGPLLVTDAQPAVLAVSHLAALALLWTWARRVDTTDQAAFTAFYMRVWQLFFCEYVIVPLAVVLG